MKTIYIENEVTIIDILLPDGRWLYVEFTPNNELKKWTYLNLKIVSVRDTDKSLQGTQINKYWYACSL